MMTPNIRRVTTRIWLLYFLWIFSSCNENTIDPILYGTVEGSITYREDGLPAAGVEITTSPATGVLMSDENGKFVIVNAPVGNLTITARADGFDNETQTVTVVRNQTTTTVLAIESTDIAPEAPTMPSPANHAANVPTTATLKWFTQKKNKLTLSFDVKVYEGTAAEPFFTLSDFSDTSTVVENLKYNTNYFWQVVAKNTAGQAINSELWHFTTTEFPLNDVVFASIVDGNFEIYSNDATGNTAARLTNSPLDQVSPLFSTSGEKIAFVTRTISGDQVFVMNSDGSDSYQVTTIPAASYNSTGRNFCWSPDNGRIMYSHYDKLYTIDRNGYELTLVATAPTGKHFRDMHWTGAGNNVIVEVVGALPYDNELRLIQMANPTDVDSVVVVDLPGVVGSPMFSPDGKSIVYTYDKSGFESDDGRQLDTRIVLFNLVTKAHVDLSKEKPAGTNDFNPRFSATGASVIFENTSNTNNSSSSVFIVEVSDLKRRKAFDNAYMPDWR